MVEGVLAELSLFNSVCIFVIPVLAPFLCPLLNLVYAAIGLLFSSYNNPPFTLPLANPLSVLMHV